MTFTFRIHLHDFLFNFVGSCLSLFDDFRLKIAVPVARNSDFALAIVADYRLFPVTNSACCPMLCGVHATLWGQLRKHPVCDCFRSCYRLQSSSRSQDVRPFQPRASALSSRQTAFSALPECLRWLRPTSWSDSLPSAASQVPSLDHLIRVFFSCAIPHFLWVLLAFTRFGIQPRTIKWNRSYIRARRRGLKSLFLEFGMISCGFNLHKFHLKKVALRSAA